MAIKITQLTVYGVIAGLAFCFAFLTVIDLAMHLSSQRGPQLHHSTDSDHLHEVMVDIFLVLLFITQHSVMASMWFKQWVLDKGLIVVERAVYVICTCLTLRILMVYWMPIAGFAVWEINTNESFFLWLFFTLLHAVAWIVIYGAALTMDLPEMLGVKQVYYYSMGLELPITLKSRGAQKLYKHMRHPGTSCFLLILWVHPVMTVSRALLALLLTIYLLIGHNVKERDYLYLREQLMRKRVRLVRMELVD